jgi:peptidoglycan hydrolase CwlO-like protein
MGMESVVAMITAMVALVGVVVSVFTLSQSARKDAFQQLQSIVDELKKQLEKAEKENERLVNEVQERDEKIEELSQRLDAQDALIASLRTMIDMKRDC